MSQLETVPGGPGQTPSGKRYAGWISRLTFAVIAIAATVYSAASSAEQNRASLAVSRESLAGPVVTPAPPATVNDQAEALLADGRCHVYPAIMAAVLGTKETDPALALHLIREVPVCEGAERRALMKEAEGEALGNIGHYDEAVATLLDASALNQLALQLKVATQQGHWDRLAGYLQAIEHHKDKLDTVTAFAIGDAYINLAKHFDSVGQAEPALTAYERAATWDPRLGAYAAGVRARILWDAGRRSEAIAVIGRALAASPQAADQYSLLRRLGSYWEAQAQPGYAYCAYNQALGLVDALPASMNPADKRAELNAYLARVIKSAGGQQANCQATSDQWQPQK